MMIGMLLTIAVLVTFLAWVNRKHVELQEARGYYGGTDTPLERVLVASAVVAILGFFVWFFGFSGSSRPYSRCSRLDLVACQVPWLGPST